jgi:hypothetical protein
MIGERTRYFYDPDLYSVQGNVNLSGISTVIDFENKKLKLNSQCENGLVSIPSKSGPWILKVTPTSEFAGYTQDGWAVYKCNSNQYLEVTTKGFVWLTYNIVSTLAAFIFITFFILNIIIKNEKWWQKSMRKRVWKVP